MHIDRFEIRADALPYVIAEIGVNHENDLERARTMIRQIAAAGGDAAKFQSYTAGKLASRYSPAYWDRSKEPTGSQFQLFQKYDRFGASEYRALAEACREAGIAFLSTPFDLEAVDMLDPLVPVFKVASADITNLPLLESVAGRGKPVLLSTGSMRSGSGSEKLARRWVSVPPRSRSSRVVPCRPGAARSYAARA